MPAPAAPAGRQPLIVIEGPSSATAREANGLRSAGFEVIAGFRLPIGRRRNPTDRPPICAGTVATASDAADALLAAIAGAGLVVDAVAERPTVDRLVDDLRRIGPVDHRIVHGAAPDPELPPDAQAILRLLAEGHSLGEAASSLGMARRTADRRLRLAREALGVTRTTEAIARAAALDLLGPREA